MSKLDLRKLMIWSTTRARISGYMIIRRFNSRDLLQALPTSTKAQMKDPKEPTRSTWILLTSNKSNLRKRTSFRVWSKVRRKCRNWPSWQLKLTLILAKAPSTSWAKTPATETRAPLKCNHNLRLWFTEKLVDMTLNQLRIWLFRRW